MRSFRRIASQALGFSQQDPARQFLLRNQAEVTSDYDEHYHYESASFLASEDTFGC